MLALVGLLGISAQWLGWWLKLPSMVLLLLAGIVLGPVTGAFDPDALFGDLLFPTISLGVAVVLFEGSLTLRFREIRGHGEVVSRLVTLGLVVTWLLTGIAAHFLLGLGWELALLLGALVSVTGPTVIAPLLRTAKPKARVGNVLRWEGILVDPLGAMLAVLVYEFIVSGQHSGHALLVFGKILLVGVVAGTAGAGALATALRRHWLPEYLHAPATLVWVLAIFSASNALVHESGLLAVTVMGAVLANLRRVPVEEILDFKESLTLLLVSGLFIVLAARLDPRALLAVGPGAAVFIVSLMLLVRPATVWLATVGSSLSWSERGLIAWLAPRGIIAAAVSSLFALRLEDLGYEQAELLVSVTFLVIITTVLVQGASARVVARLLGVAEPVPRGVLILGANRAARAIAESLRDIEYRVQLADSNWDDVAKARLQGLPTYYGNPVSEHADRHLELFGLGQLFAMSPRPALNTLACLRFRPEFGRDQVFELAPPKAGGRGEEHGPRESYRFAALFGSEVTYAKLASLIASGAEIRATRITESFDYHEYRKQHGSRALPLFALDEGGRLHVFTPQRATRPESGWTVVSLLFPQQGSFAAGPEPLT